MRWSFRAVPLPNGRDRPGGRREKGRVAIRTEASNPTRSAAVASRSPGPKAAGRSAGGRAKPRGRRRSAGDGRQPAVAVAARSAVHSGFVFPGRLPTMLVNGVTWNFHDWLANWNLAMARAPEYRADIASTIFSGSSRGPDRTDRHRLSAGSDRPVAEPRTGTCGTTRPSGRCHQRVHIGPTVVPAASDRRPGVYAGEAS